MTSDPSGSEPFSPFPLLLLTQATSRRRLCPFLLNLPALKILQSFSFFLKSSFPQLPEFSTWWGAKARSGWLTLTPRANCSLAPLPAPCSVASHWKLEIGRGGDIYTTEIGRWQFRVVLFHCQKAGRQFPNASLVMGLAQKNKNAEKKNF